MLLSLNLIGKQKRFDDVPMDEIESPANHPFTLPEKQIIFPENQPANLVCGRPPTRPASRRKRRAPSTKSICVRRRPISRPHLEAWFKGHPDDQYPTKEVVNDLAAKENLKFDQVKGWLGRRRKRMADASSSRNSSPGSDNTLLQNYYPSADTRAQAPSDPGISHDFRREYSPGLEERDTALSLVEKLTPCPSTSPIEQYTMTPPREDCSPIQTSISVQIDEGLPRFSRRTTRYSNMGYRPMNVIDRGTGTAPGPVMSFSTTSSLHSSQDFSITSGEKPTLPLRQKGKRIASQKQYPPERQDKKIFQCTRCNIGYRFPSDWARHLEIHEPQQYYTCMLQGETVVIRGNVACPFCDEFDPTQDHLRTHNVSRCADKTHEKRTFQRRDHMLSHMKRNHNSLAKNPPDAWMTVVHADPNQQFWCGFCRSFLRTTWDSRLQHLSNHFKVDDLDMTVWSHEGTYLPSLPDFAHSIGTTHSMDPAHPTGSIHPTSNFYPVEYTPPMNHPFMGAAAFMGPAPPMVSDHPLDAYYPMSSDPEIDPALLDLHSYLTGAPLPDQSAFSEALDLDSENVQD